MNPMSSIEELLEALINGTSSDIAPLSRAEAYLKNLLEGLGTAGLPPPQSRLEAYLYTLAEKGMGGSDPITDFGYFCYYGRRLDTIANGINTSAGTSFDYMFYECQNLESISQLDTKNGTNFKNMFYNCKNLTSIPPLDTGKGTDFSAMFSGCMKLTTVHQLDTKNGTNFSNMFSSTSYLVPPAKLDTRNGTDFSAMFHSCYGMKTVPEIDTSNGTDFSSMFGNGQMGSIPPLDTRKGTKFGSMFASCNNLSTISHIDLRNATSVYNIVNTSYGVRNIGFYNIKISLSIVPSRDPFGSVGTCAESLIGLIRELIDTGSAKTFTIGTTYLSRIADTYVKLVPITDEMRAEDEFIDQKLPFEVCESTDEGAMLITDYVGEKNWSIK